MPDLLGTRGGQTSHVQVVGAPARGHQSSPTSTSTSTSTSRKVRIGPRLTALDPAIGSPAFHALVMSENKTRARLLQHSDLHFELDRDRDRIRAVACAFSRVLPCHEEVRWSLVYVTQGRGTAREAAKCELEEAGKTSVLGDLWGNDKDEKTLLFIVTASTAIPGSKLDVSLVLLHPQLSSRLLYPEEEEEEVRWTPPCVALKGGTGERAEGAVGFPLSRITERIR
ncbi:hypothetical protein V8D89_000403 [Ganoderma adspersum]